MLFPAAPAVVAVTVTTAALEVAVTPTLVLFLLIAAARLAARFAFVPSVRKFVPVFEPSLPPLSVPVLGDKVMPLPLLLENAMLLPAEPAVRAVTVTTAAERVADTLAFATVPGP
jgi:hypothetical protein